MKRPAVHSPHITERSRRWLRLRFWGVPAVFFLLSGFALAQMDNRPEMVAEALAEQEPQPSETAAQNFPGSAFYYLDDDTGLIAEAAMQTTKLDDGASADGAFKNGTRPTATPIKLAGTALDRNRALQCLTAAVYYEAALEPDAGQRAVAQVVLNRVAHPSYPATICGVVYQGSERSTGCQFTFSCDGSMARDISVYYWGRARDVAKDALGGKVYAPASLATHYHTTEVSPYWAPSLNFLGTIGAHRFYSWKGVAGLKSAFHQSYRGHEPLPQPKPRLASVVPATATDPLSLARAYETAKAEAERKAADTRTTVAAVGTIDAAAQAEVTRVPSYSTDAIARGGEQAFGGGNLPDASQVRPEYRNSGRWIAQP